MSAEYVLDASVVGAAFFVETASAAAVSLLRSEADWVAPDLIFAEVANIAAMKLRRSQATPEAAAKAVPALKRLLATTFPNRDLAERAFELAADHGFSAYDAHYLVVAERRGVRLVTADAKLAARAEQCGLGSLVQRL